jgi:glycosyltransferase involved in cell wall biosynthesis
VKISFVIPAYNEEKFLGACLESVIKEIGSRDDEIIVVNNASTDKTREIALRYGKVKIVDEPKKGLVAARAAGFKASTGELIANIDADSILPKSWLNYALTNFENNKSLAGLSGPFIYYDLEPIVNLGIWIYYFFGYLSHLINQYVLRVGALLQGGNIVMCRSAFEKTHGYNLDLVFWGEDIDLARSLSKVGTVKFTFKQPMYSSGRRLKKEGVLTMMIVYPLNYFSTTFFKKPFNQSYQDIRGSTSEKLVFKTTKQNLSYYVLALQILLLLVTLFILYKIFF